LKSDPLKESAIANYIKWVEEVKAKVPPEKLLVFDVHEGWKPLCEFLGKEVPEVPFPHLNDSPKLNEMFQRLEFTGMVVFIALSTLLTVACTTIYTIVQMEIERNKYK
jgi:hypothetical protein